MAPTLSAIEYRLLVDHSPVMIWRSGTDAKCDYFNDTWLEFTGRTIDEERGDGWAEGVHPDDLEPCVTYYLDHFHRRAPFEMEYRLRRHDGVFRWIFDRGVPYEDEAGAFAGFIGSCVDVDDRRRAQAADRNQLASAREFEHWILGIVGHDIRNPLGAIDAAAKLLSLRATEPSVRDIAARIDRSVGRITHIVGDLLDLTRERQGGSIPLTLGPADLHDVCRIVAEELVAKGSASSIEVVCRGEVTGTWDAQRLTQALSNLVGNAIKHGTQGAPIQVRCHANERQAIAEVHNHGGIRPDVLSALFEPFASRREPSSLHDGLGLGLFIARSIARAHRGDLHVESDHDRGTTFRLVLPRSTEP